MTAKGKTAIVTGGERGIGKAIVEKLLSEGMNVCIAGIDTAAADETLGQLDAGNRVLFCETDVGDEDAVKRVVSKTLEAFGRIDALVANAGIAAPGNAPVEDLELGEWERVIRTNLTGCFLCAKHAFPELRKRKGAMVLIASTRALQSEPNTTAYSASKGGVVALAHSLAMSDAPEVRVNCISPGWIHLGESGALSKADHNQHPVGRVGQGSDIANMAAYLLSDAAGFVSGQNFVVDGGMTKKMIYCD